MSYYTTITEDVTIEEFVKRCKKSRLWLCPRHVLTGKIDRSPLLQGIECSKHTIPDEIKQCKVTRHFVEGGLDCIIWENRYIEDHLEELRRQSQNMFD